jgi:hypothetical protein
MRSLCQGERGAISIWQKLRTMSQNGLASLDFLSGICEGLETYFTDFREAFKFRLNPACKDEQRGEEITEMKVEEGAVKGFRLRR